MGNACSGRSANQQKPTFPRLSSPHATIKPEYDVVVIGSGYGASIAASRCARAGQATCVLERGKEWLPGEFPETKHEGSKEMQITFGGKKTNIGEPSNLYDIFVTDDLSVVQGCGLGGGSLINANVALDSDPDVFEDSAWPKDLREDLHSLMTVDRQHVVKMLRPTPYPDHYPPLHKIERMKEGLSEFDIEDLDKMFYKTPLYVTFEDTPRNHVGIPQPKCTACGNCCGGCNVGAKNTLNLNYLPDAKAHGAEIFTEVEVLTVLKADNSSEWLVTYKRLAPDHVKEQTVRARFVILGAGALGSTKILLRSKEKGLVVSDALGKRFSTNGDMLGFSYNGNQKANALGIETKKFKGARLSEPPGPTVTSIMDFRKVLEGHFEDHFVIEDGTFPSVLSVLFKVAVTIGAKVIGIDKFPTGEFLEKILQEIQGEAIDNTIALLGMSHDDAGGVISFDKKNDNIDITWDRVGFDRNFEAVNQALEKVTRGLGGTFVKNPQWVDALGKSVVTVHPLGGCPMGESGRTGVVNHAGHVFDGETSDILDGLYVVDGAILPRAVGVNPSLTIACLAERCIRLLAQREGWHIDYDTFIPLGKKA